MDRKNAYLTYQLINKIFYHLLLAKLDTIDKEIQLVYHFKIRTNKNNISSKIFKI